MVKEALAEMGLDINKTRVNYTFRVWPWGVTVYFNSSTLPLKEATTYFWPNDYNCTDYIAVYADKRAAAFLEASHKAWRKYGHLLQRLEIGLGNVIVDFLLNLPRYGASDETIGAGLKAALKVIEEIEAQIKGSGSPTSTITSPSRNTPQTGTSTPTRISGTPASTQIPTPSTPTKILKKLYRITAILALPIIITAIALAYFLMKSRSRQ